MKWIYKLDNSAGILNPEEVGGKGANLSRLIRLGFQIPSGFCISANAYQLFIKENKIHKLIDFELDRKPIKNMRWEEIWDMALRIRFAFSHAKMPVELKTSFSKAYQSLGDSKTVAVRSSALGEDSESFSFAGIHESILNVCGYDELEDAIKLVWSSLWSDAAMLYLKELNLNPRKSKMAVVIQQMENENISGVAFGQDPTQPNKPYAIIEAVTGPCHTLVDGLVNPDRWILEHPSGRVVHWTSGNEPSSSTLPLLNDFEIKQVYRTLEKVKKHLQFTPDIEWTGTNARFTLLQARPVTSLQEQDDIRNWYQSLKLSFEALNALYHKVVDTLIPTLQQQGHHFSQEELEPLEGNELAQALLKRYDATLYWRKVYYSDFIPFAHGVRYLAMYYNDKVKPADPYEFVGLLEGQQMISMTRNQALKELVGILKSDPELKKALEAHIKKLDSSQNDFLQSDKLAKFIQKVDKFMQGSMDFVFEGVRLVEAKSILFQQLCALSEHEEPTKATNTKGQTSALTKKLLNKLPEKEHQHAKLIIKIGQVSWKLRDDDNLLLSRIESQFLKSVKLALIKLNALPNTALDIDLALQAAPDLIDALQNNKKLENVKLSKEAPKPKLSSHKQTRPRQLTGQPAAKGLVSGKACIVQQAQDLANFRSGDVIVCKAIQPMMTHLIPLAGGIIEERGGMLIHGAIIARELNIPCVNGVSHALEYLKNGDSITLDGYLGIVTIGETEFDKENDL